MAHARYHAPGPIWLLAGFLTVVGTLMLISAPIVGAGDVGETALQGTITSLQASMLIVGGFLLWGIAALIGLLERILTLLRDVEAEQLSSQG